MEIQEQIKREIEKVPEPYLKELYDFIRFLEKRGYIYEKDGGGGHKIQQWRV